MTLAVLNLLREQGVIQVPWPELRWEVQPDAEETPIEQLQWRLTWKAYARAELPIALKDYLESVPRDDYGLAIRLRLWSDLAVVETERFFEQQLAKHRFDAGWAQDLVFVHRDTKNLLSAAQWRYCVWAATRHGASVSLQQHTPDAAGLREAIYAELKRRAARVCTGDWGNCSFAPYQNIPQSALGRIFTCHLTKLGLSYWMAPPSIEGLLFQAAL